MVPTFKAMQRRPSPAEALCSLFLYRVYLILQMRVRQDTLCAVTICLLRVAVADCRLAGGVFRPYDHSICQCLGTVQDQ